MAGRWPSLTAYREGSTPSTNSMSPLSGERGGGGGGEGR